MSDSVCTCNDVTLKTADNCLNCKNDWDRPLKQYERRQKCPIHENTIRVCAPGYSLCPTCTDQGYYIQGTDTFLSSSYKIMKK